MLGSMEERIKAGEFENTVIYPKKADFKNEADYRAARREYNVGLDNAVKRFQEAALEDLGIPKNHPKLDAFLRITWENGHAYCYQSVWGSMVELSELLVF